MYPHRPALLALCPALYAALCPTRRDLMNPPFPSSRLPLITNLVLSLFLPSLPSVSFSPCHSTCAALTFDCPRHALALDLYMLFLPRCPQPRPLPCALSPLSCPMFHPPPLPCPYLTLCLCPSPRDELHPTILLLMSRPCSHCFFRDSPCHASFLLPPPRPHALSYTSQEPSQLLLKNYKRQSADLWQTAAVDL